MRTDFTDPTGAGVFEEDGSSLFEDLQSAPISVDRHDT
jgi:hypothetical protein